MRKTMVLFSLVRLSAAFQLAFFTGLSLWVYWWGMVRPAPLLKLFSHALPDFFRIYKVGSPEHLGLILSFLILGMGYALAYRLVLQMEGRAAWLLVFAGAVLFGLVLMQAFPYDAADIFDAILHGRMLAVYGQNPYTHIPLQFESDPFYRLVAWKREASPYGPVWGLLATLASRLAGEGIPANVYAFKLVPGAFLLGSMGLLAWGLQPAGSQKALAGALLLGWNPLVLYETWGNGHNDMVMVFFMIAAVVAFRRGRFTLGILALEAATLVKFVPVLFLPAAGLVALQSLPDWRRRAGFAARTALAGLALAALVYLPFWAGPRALTVLTRSNLFTSTLPASLYYSLVPALGEHAAATLVSRAALLATLAFTAWQTWLAAKSREPDRLARACFNIAAFYLLVTALWFQQWYTVWLIGLAPLVQSTRLRRLALVFAFAALSKQLAAGPLLFWTDLHLAQPWLEILFTLGVLGVPWLYALVTLKWKPRPALETKL